MSKILIADDSKLMRNMLKKIFKDEKSFIFIEADNGKSAFNLYKKEKPDLVTMDVTMNVVNGLDAAKMILEFDSKASIVMITALGRNIVLNDCKAIGVKDVIVKPFSDKKVKEVLMSVLQDK